MKMIRTFTQVVCMALMFASGVFSQTIPSAGSDLQLRMERLKLTITQSNDKARAADQQAANEDQLASSSAGWTKTLHQLAAMGYRKQAADARKTASEALADAERLQSSIAPPSPSTAGSVLPAAFTPPVTATGTLVSGTGTMHLADTDDYLTLEDPSAVEKKIESYLNKAGVKAVLLIGGSSHYVSIRYKSETATPNFEYRISALPPHSGESGFQLIGITLFTNFETGSPSPGDQLTSSLLAAGKTSDCSFYVDGGSIRCTAWVMIPQKVAIPTEVVLGRIYMMNSSWSQLSAKVAATSK